MADSRPSHREVPVPGERAPTVRVSAMVNSLPRWLLKTRCSLAGFLLSIVKNPSSVSHSTSALSSAEKSNAGLWPMPIPYPEVFTGRCRSPDAWLKKLVSLEVVVLSWLHLGCPDGAPVSLRLGSSLTRHQWNVVMMMRGLSADSNTPEFVDPVAMGRAASKFEDVDAAISSLSRAAGELQFLSDGYVDPSGTRPSGFDDTWCRAGILHHSLPGASLVTAKPIDPERLSFPAKPKFDPIPFFDGATTEAFLHPLDGAIPFADYEGEVPMVKVNGTKEAKLGLYKQLFETGRLQPVPLSFVRGKFTSGLFTVTKDGSRDRLILDARPPNLLEKGLTHWCASMAGGTSLVDIVVGDTDDLAFSGLDLKDYFYQFMISEQRVRRNILAGELTLAEARQVFGKDFEWPEPKLAVSLSTLAMGDLNSVEFAQASHLGLCLQGGVVFPDELISMRSPIPRSPLMLGIVIDDLVVIEFVAKELLVGHLEFAADERIEKALAGYAAAGLEANPKKSFRNVNNGKFWGVEIDGKRGLLRSSSSRLWPLIFMTARVARLGWSTVKLLECLAGCWVSILTVRRRLLCVMDIIFEPLGLPDPKQVIQLSPELVSELFCLCALGPLAVADLRASFLPFVGASDASSEWMAAVRAELDSRLVSEFSRFSLKKSNWTKLLPPGKAWLKQHDLLEVEEELPGEVYDCHPLWSLLANCLTYKERWRSECRKGRHINISELLAFLKEEKFICSGELGKRFLFGLDSQVALGCLVKGRASSASLNRCLKSSLCYPIGSGVYQYVMYFPSEVNRADGPTRHSQPAAPSEPIPGRFDTFLGGDPEPFDSWRTQVEKGVVEPAFVCGDLLNGESVDLKPKRRRQRKRRTTIKRKSELEEQQPSPASEEIPSELSQEAIDMLKSISPDQFLTADGSPPDFRRAGALDLYSGSYGLAKSLLRKGAPWVLTYELKHSAAEDLLEASVQSAIMKMTQLLCFKSISMAPVCASFSVAVTPPVRTTRYPMGRPGLSKAMRLKVAAGNGHCSFCAQLGECCQGLDVGFMIENPDTSWMWRQKKMKQFRDPSSRKLFRFSFCRFGTAWKKNTRMATNTRLGGLRMMCSCSMPHHQLRGFSKAHRRPWTAVAEPYPYGLCQLVGTALCCKAGWLSNSKLNISGCARSKSMRIGEAQNPGPAGRGSLEELPGLSVHTMAMESRLLREFLQWAQGFLGTTTPSQLFDLVPSFMGTALRCYGDIMFQSMGSHANLRHLILACQRWKPHCRPFTSNAWELVRRWEYQEPVTHRLPIPESLVKGLCSLAWMHGWFEWVGATLLSFYGGGRVGEVLRCRKFDLILPVDTMEEGVDSAFLQLRNFKSYGRQPARVQHMKISDRNAVKILSKIYSNFEASRILYFGTPSQYRRRWDFLLRSFRVGADIKLTPGGLRGGFAVWGYRKGIPITEILWRLRLRNQSTLESYLQETGTLTVYSLLSRESRLKIEQASSLFVYLHAALSSQGGESLPTTT